MFTKPPKIISIVLVINKMCSLIFKFKINSDMLCLKAGLYFIFKAQDNRWFFFNPNPFR